MSAAGGAVMTRDDLIAALARALWEHDGTEDSLDYAPHESRWIGAAEEILPVIVVFVAEWIEREGAKHPGAKECAAQWRQEMGEAR